MGAAKSFTDFKTDFYAKVKDFSLFDCAEFNALKIVLDGLKVDYISRGKVTVDLFKPVWVQHLKYQLKAAKAGKISLSTNDILQFKNRKILIADDGRITYDESKKPHSYYFSNIIKHFGKENCTHLVEKVRDENLGRNLDYPLVYQLFIHQKYNDDELKLRQSVITTFNNIKAAQIFDEKEIQNIAFAFQNFFNQYKVWSRLLNSLSPEKFYTICHYHNEGRALAIKRKGIFYTELQHGLIATKDIFYVFPAITKSIIHKALFADRILVFGAYWKSVLEKGVEYSSEKIEKIGYYLYDDFDGFEEIKHSIHKFADGKKIILITTQTSLHEYFVTYIKWLANDIEINKLPYKIIVKNHPLEKAEHYKIIEDIANVKIMNCPLPLLFKQSSLHISIYSTTLFDGVRYGIAGYALDVAQCADYVNELVASGVAKKIGLNQNPTSLEAINSSLDSQYFYEQFENSVGIL